MDFTAEIKGHTLEYFDDEHMYLVDGLIVPSITQILKLKFGRKYESINDLVLKRASDAGTAVHEAVEAFYTKGIESDMKEVRNIKFLQKKYGFEVIDNEVPVILFKDDEPISAGRLDLVLYMDGEIGGADIKRTSSLDKEYLFYQLNLYRIGYQQCYGEEWQFLRGIHLKDDIRKFVKIPINADMAWQLVEEYLEANNGNKNNVR